MEIYKVKDVFDALRQENRLKIFKILVQNSEKGVTPTEISDLMEGMPKNSVSTNLNILFQADLCVFTRCGKQIIYKPKCETIKQIAAFLLKDCCEGGYQC